MNIKRFFCFLFLACISLFGLSLNTVHADEVEINQSNSISYRYDDESSWSNISGASDLVNGHTYQVRFQFTPFYSFLDSHYYKLRLTFNHNAGTYTFDYANFYNSSYQGVQYDTSTYSATFNNIDATHCQLILDGVRDVDINRQIQRIRFFFNDTVAIDSGYNSASIRINDVHLYVSDVTEAYVLPQIDDKLNDTNNKLDEGNQKKQTIIDRLTNLPNAIRDMLLGFFVPSSEEFDDFIDDFNDLIYLRLGCVAQTLDFFGDVIDSFVHATAEDQIYIPRLEITVPINNGQVVAFHTLTLWQGGYINVMPTEWSFAANNIDYIRTIIDIICLFMLFRYLLNVFYSIVSPELTESMTLHEILEELEFRTLD